MMSLAGRSVRAAPQLAIYFGSSRAGLSVAWAAARDDQPVKSPARRAADNAAERQTGSDSARKAERKAIQLATDQRGGDEERSGIQAGRFQTGISQF
jgi:hypothetical protein